MQDPILFSVSSGSLFFFFCGGSSYAADSVAGSMSLGAKCNAKSTALITDEVSEIVRI